MPVGAGVWGDCEFDEEYDGGREVVVMARPRVVRKGPGIGLYHSTAAGSRHKDAV